MKKITKKYVHIVLFLLSSGVSLIGAFLIIRHRLPIVHGEETDTPPPPPTESTPVTATETPPPTAEPISTELPETPTTTNTEETPPILDDATLKEIAPEAGLDSPTMDEIINDRNSSSQSILSGEFLTGEMNETGTLLPPSKPISSEMYKEIIKHGPIPTDGLIGRYVSNDLPSFLHENNEITHRKDNSPQHNDLLGISGSRPMLVQSGLISTPAVFFDGSGVLISEKNFFGSQNKQGTVFVVYRPFSIDKGSLLQRTHIDGSQNFFLEGSSLWRKNIIDQPEKIIDALQGFSFFIHLFGDISPSSDTTIAEQQPLITGDILSGENTTGDVLSGSSLHESGEQEQTISETGIIETTQNTTDILESTIGATEEIVEDTIMIETVSFSGELSPILSGQEESVEDSFSGDIITGTEKVFTGVIESTGLEHTLDDTGSLQIDHHGSLMIGKNFVGYIVEIGIYDRILSDEEQSQLTTYLESKYSSQISQSTSAIALVDTVPLEITGVFVPLSGDRGRVNTSVVLTIQSANTGILETWEDDRFAITGSIVNSKFSGTHTVIFTGNASGVLILYDQAGFETEFPFDVNWIDKTPPLVTGTYNTTGATSGVVTVTLASLITNASGKILDHDLFRVIDPIVAEDFTGKHEISFSENRSGTIVVQDKAENVFSLPIEINNIDNTIPDVIGFHSSWDHQHGKTCDPITISVETNESVVVLGRSGDSTGVSYLSGERGTSHRVDFSENTNGCLILSDHVGYQNCVHLSVDSIDTLTLTGEVDYIPTNTGRTNEEIAMTISFNKPVKATYNTQDFFGEMIILPGFTNNQEKVIFTANDLTSRISLHTNETGSQEKVFVPCQTLTVEGTISRIDRLAPDVDISVTPEGSTSGEKTLLLSGIFFGTGTLSGTDDDLFVIDMMVGDTLPVIGNELNVDLFSSTAEIIFLENRKGSLFIKDKAGNRTEKEINIGGIDHQSPTILSVEYLPFSRTVGPVTVTVISDEDVSLTFEGTGNSIDYQSGLSSEHTILITENGTYTGTLTDDVGNTTGLTIILTSIDNTFPELSLTHEPEYKDFGYEIVSIEAKEPDNKESNHWSIESFEADSGYSGEPEFTSGNHLKKSFSLSKKFYITKSWSGWLHLSDKAGNREKISLSLDNILAPMKYGVKILTPAMFNKTYKNTKPITGGIIIKSNEKLFFKNLIMDHKGEGFFIDFLLPGEYQISYLLPGYRKTTLTGLILTGGSRIIPQNFDIDFSKGGKKFLIPTTQSGDESTADIDQTDLMLMSQFLSNGINEIPVSFDLNADGIINSIDQAIMIHLIKTK